MEANHLTIWPGQSNGRQIADLPGAGDNGGATAQPANETMMAITLMYITIAVAAVLAVLAGAAIVIIERGR